MELFASSHGRDLVTRILELVTSSSGSFKPNARFETVTKGIESVPHDKVVCIIGGTNNTHDFTKSAKTILKDFDLNTVKRVSITNPIILLEVMRRHDSPDINGTIQIIDKLLYKILRHHRNIHIIKTHDLHRTHYTKHGLHLNASGEDFLVHKIVDEYYRIINSNAVRCEF